VIYRVSSSLPTFREVEFKPGMNVVLADQADEASDKESRNGLGKTTLLRIIHFCLGSDFAREKVLSHPDLRGFTFSLEVDVGGQRLTATRGTADPKNVRLKGALNKFEELAEHTDMHGEAKVPLPVWTELLGRSMFGLRDDAREAGLSFRALIPYFARLGRQAFNDPFDHVGKQKAWQKRTQIAFLLGLNWRQIYRWHALQKQSDEVRDLVSAIGAAEKSKEIETAGDLEARRVTLDLRLEAKNNEISKFEVRDDYRYIETRLNETDRELHKLINDNHTDRRLLEYYQESMQELTSFTHSSASDILAEAGAVFKDEALRTLEQVASFHRQVYENRRKFLEGEVTRLLAEITRRDRRVSELSQRKSGLLTTLQRGGALETFLALQQEHRDLSGEREGIVARIEERRRYDHLRDEIALQVSQLKLQAREDFEERFQHTDLARRTFAEYTGSLYEKPGMLVINLDDSGLKFDVVIDREGSDGVDQMVVFCFDLLLANLWQQREHQPGFVIHDSTLYADVDGRQKARALMLAADQARALGFQYICCLNSDTLPTEHFGEFDLSSYVRLRLSDAKPETRLLGIELPPHETGTTR